MSFNRWFLFAAGTLMLIGYVNCGEMKSSLSGGGGGSLSSEAAYPIGSDGVLFSASPVASLSMGRPLRFFSRADLFREPVQAVVWDHSLNGADFCEQTVSADGWSVTIECAEGGTLDLFFVVEYRSGADEFLQVSLNLSSELISTPTPPPPPTPTPTPPPTPTPLNGAQLYASSCAGCHGAGATSDKRRRTAAQIQNAINRNVGNMGILSTLTPAEVQAIADYLR